MLIGGRSSAAFLVEPGWDELRVIRVSPDSPAVSARAVIVPSTATVVGNDTPCVR